VNVFVFASVDTVVPFGHAGGTVHVRPGSCWYADDPLVEARPDLFSTTPVVVHSTDGRTAPALSPLAAVKRGRRG
jgi:hypothetical protein